MLLLMCLTSSYLILDKPVSADSAVDNSWAEKTPNPSPFSSIEAAVVNGIIYFMGLNYFANSSNNYAYNPRTNIWTTIAPMITPKVSFALAAYENKIYVIGGYEENNELPCGVNEMYNPSTNTWITETSMPTSRSEMAANTVNGVIYVMGGRVADSYSTNITEIYNPATDSWSTGTQMPYPVALAASAVVDNYIYVIGGEDDHHPPADSQNVIGINSVNFNQIYNPATDSWSLGTPIPTSTIDAAAGATTGVMAPKRIYVFGNIIGFRVVSNQNYAYDPATNSWTNGASMPYNTVGPAVAVLNDLFYVMGSSQNLEQYTPIGWTPSQSYLSETTPPAISILSPLNQTYNESSVPLVFTSDKAVNWTSYSLDGQQNVTITGNSTIANVTSGFHTLTVYSNDTFGNIGISKTITFTVTLPTTEHSEPLSIVTIAVVSAIVLTVILAGLVVYLKKRKRLEQPKS